MSVIQLKVEDANGQNLAVTGSADIFLSVQDGTGNAHKIRQIPVSTAVPTAGQFMQMNAGASEWEFVDDLIPSASAAYDLGSTSVRWRTAYLDDIDLTNADGLTAHALSLAAGTNISVTVGAAVVVALADSISLSAVTATSLTGTLQTAAQPNITTVGQAAVTAHEAALSIGWSQLTGAPTTLAGYGITDAASSSALSAGLATKLDTAGGTITGDLTVTGTFVTQGPSVTLNATSLSVEDTIVEIGRNNTGLAPFVGAKAERGGTDAFFVWNEATDRWTAYTSTDDLATVQTLADIAGASIFAGTAISLGSAPALSGQVRLENAGWVTARDVAGAADVDLLRLSSGDQVEIGQSDVRTNVLGHLGVNGTTLLLGADDDRFGVNGLRIFQESGNRVARLTLMPSGTADEATLRVYNGSDGVNVGWGEYKVVGTQLQLQTGAAGTGVAPDTLRINAGLDLMEFLGSKFVLGTSITPASASDTGLRGQIGWDGSYLYVCTSADTWKRAAIATW